MGGRRFKCYKFGIFRFFILEMKLCGRIMMRFWVDVGMLVREYRKRLLNFRVECLDV